MRAVTALATLMLVQAAPKVSMPAVESIASCFGGQNGTILRALTRVKQRVQASSDGPSAGSNTVMALGGSLDDGLYHFQDLLSSAFGGGIRIDADADLDPDVPALHTSAALRVEAQLREAIPPTLIMLSGFDRLHMDNLTKANFLLSAMDDTHAALSVAGGSALSLRSAVITLVVDLSEEEDGVGEDAMRERVEPGLVPPPPGDSVIVKLLQKKLEHLQSLRNIVTQDASGKTQRLVNEHAIGGRVHVVLTLAATPEEQSEWKRLKVEQPLCAATVVKQAPPKPPRGHVLSTLGQVTNAVGDAFARVPMVSSLDNTLAVYILPLHARLCAFFGVPESAIPASLTAFVAPLLATLLLLISFVVLAPRNNKRQMLRAPAPVPAPVPAPTPSPAPAPVPAVSSSSRKQPKHQRVEEEDEEEDEAKVGASEGSAARAVPVRKTQSASEEGKPKQRRELLQLQKDNEEYERNAARRAQPRATSRRRDEPASH